MSDSRVLLRGISWDTYERLLDELDNRALRLTYDRGELEIMSPSFLHERWKKLLARMIEAMTEELGVPLQAGGSTTFKRRDLDRGAEPDECYWVQNVSLVRGKTEIDLRVDPAPDLVVESEVSSSLLDRLGVLAALGVGEAWRFDGTKLTILVRGDGGRFEERSRSRCCPWLPIADFVTWLHEAETAADDTTWIRGFRAWVRATVKRTDGV
jgi:Uma2 family endonuclease